MAKEIILYNLAANVTDEEYKDYVTSEKGPLLESLTSVKKFEMVKITGAISGEIPYNWYFPFQFAMGHPNPHCSYHQ